MYTIEQALQQAEQMSIATIDEEQEYQYSTQYLHRTQYVSDNAPIEVVNKEIQSMNDEISVKGEAISQYIEFRLDRHQDGIDLLGMLFNIHYEKSFYGGEDRPINVRYNDTKIILGWAIPNAAVKEAGVLNMCIWATGRLYDDTYVWKTKPKSYTVNDGLTIAKNIIEPDENWYIQFVNELEEKIQEFSGRIDDIVQVEESLSTDVQVINEKYDSIMASAKAAGQSAVSAKTSEQNAQLYKEQTQQIAEQVKEEVTKVYKYQGSVPTYNDLPTENVSNGDVYNVESDGMNYAWDEANQKWDSLGIIIDLSKYSTTEQIELMLNQYVQKESGKGLFSGSYNDLSDKPNVNGIELSGNKTLDELGIASKTALESLSENVSTNADGITNLNNNLSQLEIDLKMLGYTVPKEMPVQNYVDSDGVFHQRVGRVDLGSLSWNRFAQNETVYLFNANFTYGKSDKNANGVCRKYSTFDTNNGWGDMPNNSIGYTTTRIRVRDDSYTNATDFKNAMQGVYLYYELASEKTISVDGNEAVTKVNDSLESLEYNGWTIPSGMPLKDASIVDKVDMGDLTWNYASVTNAFYADLQGGKIGSDNAYCSKYNRSNKTAYADMADKEFRLSVSSETVSRVFVKDLSYTDTTAFKNSLKGQYLYFERATAKIFTDGNNAIDELKSDLSAYKVTCDPISASSFDDFVKSYIATNLSKIENNHSFSGFATYSGIDYFAFNGIRYGGSIMGTVIGTDANSRSFAYNVSSGSVVVRQLSN